MNNYYKGDDLIIDLVLTDSAGDPLPPSTLAAYKAEFRLDKDPSVVTEEVTQGDFEVINNLQGEVRIRVDRSATATWREGIYNLYVLLSFTDANAEGGTRVETIKVTPVEILAK